MSDVETQDFLTQPLFALEIQGKVTGCFLDCSGLGSEHEVIEKKLVDDKGNQVLVTIPGRMKWQQITLKRGIASEDMQLWKWRKEVEDGNVEGARADGSIMMLDQHRNIKARWDFENAWPAKVTGPQLKSDSNDIGVEELTISHTGLWRVS